MLFYSKIRKKIFIRRIIRKVINDAIDNSKKALDKQIMNNLKEYLRKKIVLVKYEEKFKKFR